MRHLAHNSLRPACTKPSCKRTYPGRHVSATLSRAVRPRMVSLPQGRSASRHAHGVALYGISSARVAAAAVGSGLHRAELERRAHVGAARALFSPAATRQQREPKGAAPPLGPVCASMPPPGRSCAIPGLTGAVLCFDAATLGRELRAASCAQRVRPSARCTHHLRGFYHAALRAQHIQAWPVW